MDEQELIDVLAFELWLARDRRGEDIPAWRRLAPEFHEKYRRMARAALKCIREWEVAGVA